MRLLSNVPIHQIQSVYRHVRVCKVVDVCEVSIQYPYSRDLIYMIT